MEIQERRDLTMATHHGGKVGAAGKTLASTLLAKVGRAKLERRLQTIRANIIVNSTHGG